jgi:hypothetical protein
MQVVVACDTQHADALAFALLKLNVMYGRGAATPVTSQRIRSQVVLMYTWF